MINMGRIRVFILLGGILLALAFYMGGRLSARPAPHTSTLSLPWLGQEGEFQLADYQGQVVVLNFWSSWCEPCRREAPLFKKLHETYQPKGVALIGIAIHDTRPAAEAYIEELAIPYPNAFDLNGAAVAQYHVYGVPVTVILGRTGKIEQVFFAEPTQSELFEQIERLLG